MCRTTTLDNDRALGHGSVFGGVGRNVDRTQLFERTTTTTAPTTTGRTLIATGTATAWRATGAGTRRGTTGTTESSTAATWATAATGATRCGTTATTAGRRWNWLAGRRTRRARGRRNWLTRRRAGHHVWIGTARRVVATVALFRLVTLVRGRFALVRRLVCRLLRSRCRLRSWRWCSGRGCLCGWGGRLFARSRWSARAARRDNSLRRCTTWRWRRWRWPRCAVRCRSGCRRLGGGSSRSLGGRSRCFGRRCSSRRSGGCCWSLRRRAAWWCRTARRSCRRRASSTRNGWLAARRRLLGRDDLLGGLVGLGFFGFVFDDRIAAQAFAVCLAAGAVRVGLLHRGGGALHPDTERFAQFEGFGVRESEFTSELVDPYLLRQVA